MVYSEDGRTFCENLDSVIDDIICSRDGLSDGDIVSVFTGTPAKRTAAEFMVYDIVGLLEDAAERSYDECEDFADGWLEDVPEAQSRELKEGLSEAVNAWATKYGHHPSFYTVVGVKELKVKIIDIEKGSFEELASC